MSLLQWWQTLGVGLRTARRPVVQSIPTTTLRTGSEIWKIGYVQSKPPSVTRLGFRPAAPISATSQTEYSTEGGNNALPPLPEFCSGCGVKLQDFDQEKPGYYQVPKNWGMEPLQDMELVDDDEDLELDDEDDVPEDEIARMNAEIEAAERASGEAWVSTSVSDFDIAVDGWLDEYEKKKGKRGPRKEEKVDVTDWGDDEASTSPPLFCARCFSLTNYGKVKNEVAETRLPDFDIGKKVGQKIRLRRFRRSVVLVVVDVSDFDGSLPRSALKAVLPRDAETGGLRTPNDTDLIIAVNKVDLVPSETTPTRLENWVRTRCKQGGVPKPRSVHLVSSHKGTGVPGLLKQLGELIGRRGDVWVVGAQNSGKSSLINALRVARKKAEAGRSAQVDPKQLLTIAALPGTTLGLIPVNGIMRKGCQMFDTPGVPHPYQLTSILTGPEAKMLLPQRQLKPRTYRIGEGATVMLGAVARIDVKEVPAATLYVTVWASDELSTHLGRTESAGTLYGKHAGTLLVPPSDPERVEALGRLEPQDIVIEGSSWSRSTVDIAIAGLGWVAIGAVGRAGFRVWAPEGVAVTTRQALLVDYGKNFCKPGFTNSRGSSTKKDGGSLKKSSRERGGGRRAKK